METATSLAIAQLSEYLRALTRRLDPGAGWYGEFLRRDPDGMRACLDGTAMLPWDVVESLLRDAGADARETEYAARLRAAAVTAWDARPGGAAELRTLLAAAAAQRATSEAALRDLTARLAAAPDAPDAEALDRELAWTRDDAARAAARCEDLTHRLTEAPLPPAVPADPPTPGPRDPAASWAPGPTHPAGPPTRVQAPAGPRVPGPRDPAGPPALGHPDPAGPPAPGYPDAGGPVPGRPALGRQRHAGSESTTGADGADPVWPEAEVQGDEVPSQPVGDEVAAPVGRAEGRWLRGGRRAGGARYAGAAVPQTREFTPPPGAAPRPPRGARFAPPEAPAPEPTLPAPRGARFGPPAPSPSHGAGEFAARGGPVQAGSGGGVPGARAGSAGGADRGGGRGLVDALVGLRAEGRSGEAHAVLCEAAAGPAGSLPGLAVELGRAGLGADWATLLWEAASLPPERLAAAAAALGDAGRHADCDALLRQGAARPTADIADAAQALATAGRSREADALLGAFVRVRTAEEAAALARRAPQWFAPRLLRAARAVSASRHRDLAHALRVAGIGTA
ncbi:hypothetical protein ACFWWA_20730 [Streptomyces goshikiensis]|uniref:hypothetical protein n=1 Tax=Streptomyces goshikiensis TaxID=1942 RepID=UPI00364730C7